MERGCSWQSTHHSAGTLTSTLHSPAAAAWTASCQPPLTAPPRLVQPPSEAARSEAPVQCRGRSQICVLKSPPTCSARKLIPEAMCRGDRTVKASQQPSQRAAWHQRTVLQPAATVSGSRRISNDAHLRPVGLLNRCDCAIVSHYSLDAGLWNPKLHSTSHDCTRPVTLHSRMQICVRMWLQLRIELYKLLALLRGCLLPARRASDL